MAILYFKTKECALMPLLIVSMRKESQPIKHTFISCFENFFSKENKIYFIPSIIIYEMDYYL